MHKYVMVTMFFDDGGQATQMIGPFSRRAKMDKWTKEILRLGSSLIAPILGLKLSIPEHRPEFSWSDKISPSGMIRTMKLAYQQELRRWENDWRIGGESPD